MATMRAGRSEENQVRFAAIEHRSPPGIGVGEGSVREGDQDGSGVGTGTADVLVHNQRDDIRESIEVEEDMAQRAQNDEPRNGVPDDNRGQDGRASHDRDGEQTQHGGAMPINSMIGSLKLCLRSLTVLQHDMEQADEQLTGVRDEMQSLMDQYGRAKRQMVSLMSDEDDDGGNSSYVDVDQAYALVRDIEALNGKRRRLDDEVTFATAKKARVEARVEASRRLGEVADEFLDTL